MSYAPHPRPALAGAPSGKGGRPLWHWLVLGGGVLIALLVAAVIAGLILWQVLSRGNPQNTLEDFYQSLQDTDCEMFEDSTTERFRDVLGIASCQEFESAFSAFDGIDYEIEDRLDRQGYAIFTVTETYTEGAHQEQMAVRYYVRRIDGQWDLDAIEIVDDDG